MDKTASELLKNRKYDLLIAMLVDRSGADETARIWLDAERRLSAFLKNCVDLSSGERAHAEGTIYPMCALYLAMAEQYGRDEAFELVSEFMRVTALKAGEMLQTLLSVPALRPAFVKAFGVVGARKFGDTAGFEQKLYDTSSHHLRMDILSCPYARHCTEAGAPELAVLFCKNDEYAYGNLPGIEFKRAGTVARGDDCCDFELTLVDGRR